MTQSNYRASQRSFGEGSVWMVYQKSGALNLTNNTLHSENVVWTKDPLHDT